MSDDDDDDDDEDEGDDDDDDEDVQSEEAPSQTFTVGDLIEAMKTKKKIPVSQPSSVVNNVFHFVSLLIVSGLKMWFIVASWWGIQYLCACTIVACEQAYYDSQSKPQENMRAGRVSGDVASG